MKTKIITLIFCMLISACSQKVIKKEQGYNVIWPKCFITGEFDYGDNEIGRVFAVADGLMGWSNIKLEEPPKYFSYCIIKMSNLLNIEPDEEEFINAANAILGLK